MAVRPIHHGCHTEASGRLRHGVYWAEALILDHFTQRVLRRAFGRFQGCSASGWYDVPTSKPMRTNFRQWQLPSGKTGGWWLVRNTAQLRSKRYGGQVYQESQTFARKQARTFELKLGDFLRWRKHKKGARRTGR